MKATNGFRRRCVGYNAQTGKMMYAGSNTYVGSGSATLEVPDDGLSVVGQIIDEKYFRPTEILTAAQAGRAVQIARDESCELVTTGVPISEAAQARLDFINSF